MAGRDGQGQVFSPGSRKRDRTVDDALKTMERLGQWLETAREEDVWRQMDDPLQIAMLHGLLSHLQQEIEQFLALGGNEMEETVRKLRTLAFAGLENSEHISPEGSGNRSRRIPDVQGGDGAGG
jgi:hypothetical protein